MSKMFNGAASTNPDVSKWNVSNVTNMNSMFVGASKVKANITGLPMGKFMAFML